MWRSHSPGRSSYFGAYIEIGLDQNRGGAEQELWRRRMSPAAPVDQQKNSGQARPELSPSTRCFLFRCRPSNRSVSNALTATSKS